MNYKNYTVRTDHQVYFLYERLNSSIIITTLSITTVFEFMVVKNCINVCTLAPHVFKIAVENTVLKHYSTSQGVTTPAHPPVAIFIVIGSCHFRNLPVKISTEIPLLRIDKQTK